MTQNPDAVLARVVRSAKKKAASIWNVLKPIEDRPLGEQASALAGLFASGALGPQHTPALEALAHVLKLANHTDGEPQGLGPAAAKLLTSAKKTPGRGAAMFEGYSFALDVIVAFGWAKERDALAGLVKELDGGARLGLESVRFRFDGSVEASLEGRARRRLRAGDWTGRS